MKEVDYKDTLNLPKTSFPMKANLPNKEIDFLKFWERISCYRQVQSAKKDKEVFILADGPPYANGNIHVGHALNKVLKDIVIKSKWMSGYQSPYVPGWDCHGLPIELNIEKKYGKPGNKIDHQTFRKYCREYANKQIENQREDFIRLGVFGDWNKPYFTMQAEYEANIIRALAVIVENGHLKRGDRPVYWCLDCQSSLAEAEVEYKNKTSLSIYACFFVQDTKQLAAAFKTDSNIDNYQLVIWTTTPWSLPANQAVCCNPDIEYALVKSKNINYIIAKELVKEVMLRADIVDYKIMATSLGRELEGLKLIHPFLERTVPIILGEHVTIDTGTGCVHTAPAHGLDDYLVGKKYNLPVNNPVQANGCFADDIPNLAGVHIKQANTIIMDLLKTAKLILAEDSLEHSYPHCWRHKTALIFRATPQWFISMDEQDLRTKALQAIKKVKWVPSWGQERIEKMLINRPDWCISRQRTWGVPMAMFIHKKTNKLHPDTPKLMRKVAEQIAIKGIDAWHEITIEQLLKEEANDYIKVPDILDVWFDSGVMHYCILRNNPELHIPADLFLEGSDQHRGWFQSSLLTSIAMSGEPPYKQVLTHGFTVDAAGHKMSKSLGNVVSPQEIIKSLGADVWRLWVAANDYRGDLSVSKEILKRMADAYRRIRNTAKFLLSNLHEFNIDNHAVSSEDLVDLDKWIINKTKVLQAEIISAYNEYQFHVIYQKLHNFCIVDLGGFYLDIIKDRQYTCKKNGIPRRSAQTAMYHIIQSLVRWIAPILSFTAEEIWQHITTKKDSSIFLETWYTDFPEITSNKLQEENWQAIIKYRDAVNKFLEISRKEQNIGSGLEAQIIIYAEPEIYNVLSKLKEELRFVFITSTVYLKTITEKPNNILESEVTGLWLQITKSSYEKCQRCWHRLKDVNEVIEYPGLCKRCITNIAGEGEIRSYA